MRKKNKVAGNAGLKENRPLVYALSMSFRKHCLTTFLILGAAANARAAAQDGKAVCLGETTRTLVSSAATASPGSLKLKPLSREDVENAVRILRDPRVTGMSGDRVTDDVARMYFMEGIRGWNYPKGASHLAFAIRSDEPGGKLLGVISVWKLRPNDLPRYSLAGASGSAYGVAYHLAPEAWGKGVASRSLNGILKYAFGELGADRIGAQVIPSNTGSRRVLEKQGFQFLGHLNGKDNLSLSRSDWKPNNPAK